MSSLTEKMLKQKNAKADADKTTQNPAETGAVGSVPAGTVLASDTPDMGQKEKEAKAVAESAGATEVPKVGAVETGVMTSILEQKNMPTPEEIQAQRTEVSTNVDILNTRLIGGGDNREGLPQDPPTGTLPNSNMILENPDDSHMGQLDKQLQAGLALNKNPTGLSQDALDKANREAELWAEGEERRQRMLANRPQDTDLQYNELDGPAPAGGYKAVGITQIAMSNGSWFKAQNGYFVPENEEQYNELEHFVKKGLVEKP